MHVYFRLVDAVKWQSREAGWVMRCLRKLLRSWNITTRQKSDRDHVRAECELGHELIAWLKVDGADGGAEGGGATLACRPGQLSGGEGGCGGVWGVAGAANVAVLRVGLRTPSRRGSLGARTGAMVVL